MSACLAQPPVQTSDSTLPPSPTPPTPLPTPLVRAATWRRSSYSTGANNCVESARTRADGLAVRDSKDVSLPHLTFTPGAWTAFVHALREEAPAS
ncbi:DUF397 domain-containing protein [Streptomyces sp. NPDC088116]|uniref:DUF397 domain-containing protein n=1 Tax=Streptomyces sp. NPDC088116 TaxID=3365825 RepID=UPI003800337C